MDAFEQIWDNIRNLNFKGLPLEGPEAGSLSVADGYPSKGHHGAFYFYLMAPSAVLSNFHPYGPALFTILLNSISVYLIFFFTRQIFDEKTGLIAASLLAISSFAVLHSRWAWNPNLIVFFLLLSVIGLLNIIRREPRFWPLFMFAASALTQVFILGYAFVLVVFLPVFFFRSVPRPKWKTLFLTEAAFVIPLVPEIISEVVSRFSLTKTAALFVQRSFESSASHGIPSWDVLLFSFKSLLGFSGLGSSIGELYLFPIALLLCMVVAGFKGAEMARTVFRNPPSLSRFYLLPMTYRAVVLSPKLHLILLWFCAAFAIALLFYARYGDINAQHALLFALPLTTIIYARIARVSFSHTPLIPCGIMLLGLFFYANAVGTYSQIFYPSGVSFKQEQELVDYIVYTSAGKPYEIEVGRGAEIGALLLLLKRSSFPPERVVESSQEMRFGSADAQLLYSIVVGSQRITPRCSAGTLMRSFAALHLYKCF